MASNGSPAVVAVKLLSILKLNGKTASCAVVAIILKLTAETACHNGKATAGQRQYKTACRNGTVKWAAAKATAGLPSVFPTMFPSVSGRIMMVF